MKNILFLVMALFATSLLGSEHGSEGMSAGRTLFWNFFNFAVFFVGVFYVFRQKLTIFFADKRENIEAIYTQAMEKQKAAQAEKDRMQSEITNLSLFEDKVMKDTISNTLKFKEQYKLETDAKIERAKKESENKIEATFKNGVNEIKKELMSSVIDDVEELVTKDQTVKNRVTQKIVGMIG
jgi:F0F1-type ATP synthase membrane subunit b/b'